jgi:hypothetical protein
MAALGPQPVSLEDKMKEFDSVPLFMRSLPTEDGEEESVALAALKSLTFDGTPDGTLANYF